MSIFRIQYPFNLTNIRDFYYKQITNIDPIVLDKIIKSCFISEDTLVGLGLGITTSCNLNCSMCYYHDNTGVANRSSLTPDTLDFYLSNIPNLSYVMIALEGEPTLHKQFTLILDVIAKYCTNIILVTNGNFLKDDVLEHMLKINLSKIVFSTESAHKLQYEKLRVNGNFERFCKNVKKASVMLNKTQFHVVISNENINEIDDILLLAKELGVSEVSLEQLRLCPATIQNSLQRAQKSVLINKIDNVIELAFKHKVLISLGANFADNNIMNYFVNKQHEYFRINGFKLNSCMYLYNYSNILSNGYIFPCCGDIQPIKPTSYSFNDIFNNEYMIMFRALHKLNKLPRVCNMCLNLI